MHKVCKKLIAVALGAVLTMGVASLASCSNIKLDGDYASGDVISNGGFVVEKGNYIYFINGKDDHTAENNGEVVKASLARISTSDFKAGNYANTQIVVPSLMVTANYDAGIYVYGDRVYYATPTNSKDLDGNVQNSYLDFKSCKLDGTDELSGYYFRSDANGAPYRFTEIDGVVYCMHVVGNSNIYSYNTQTKEDVLIAKSAKNIVFDDTTTTSGRVYYTMSVTVDIDSDNAYAESYNQLYTATADAKMDSFDKKTASYTVGNKTYSFDKAYLESKDTDAFDAGDIKTYPYVNLGSLVFDGIGSTNTVTPFNAGCDSTSYETSTVTNDAFTPGGYVYSVVQAVNDGIYYTRSYVDTTSSNGDGGWVFYASAKDYTASNWDPVKDNFRSVSSAEKNEVIAYNTSYASSSAIFYKEGDVNYYLYTTGGSIFRNQVNENGSVAETVRIANNASGASLMSIDKQGDYGYLYYSMSNANGNAIYRAVYNKSEEDYNIINKNKDCQPVKILNIDYVSDWYAPEIIENKIVYVNAESVGSTYYNYVSVVDLNGANGVKTNSEIVALNETYEKVTTAISDMRGSHSSLGNLMYYYYYSNGFAFPEVDPEEYFGDTNNYYDSLLAQAADEGYSSTYFYSALYQSEFEKVVAHKEGELADYTFLDDNNKYYGTRDYFYGDMAIMTEDDIASLANTWKNAMVLTLTVEETTPVWQTILLWGGVSLAGAIVIAAAIVTTVIVLKKKKARQEAIESAQPGVRHLFVDTTDDETIDVYADYSDDAKDSKEVKEEAPAEESAEAPVELPVEAVPVEQPEAQPAETEKQE